MAILSVMLAILYDPYINARARVVNVRGHVLSRVRGLKNRARAFVHGSS